MHYCDAVLFYVECCFLVHCWFWPYSLSWICISLYLLYSVESSDHSILSRFNSSFQFGFCWCTGVWLIQSLLPIIESNCTVVPCFFVSLCVSLKLCFWVESFAFHSHMYLVELLWDILLWNFCERKRIPRDLGLKNKNQWTKVIPETSGKIEIDYWINYFEFKTERKKETRLIHNSMCHFPCQLCFHMFYSWFNLFWVFV